MPKKIKNYINLDTLFLFFHSAWLQTKQNEKWIPFDFLNFSVHTYKPHSDNHNQKKTGEKRVFAPEAKPEKIVQSGGKQ